MASQAVARTKVHRYYGPRHLPEITEKINNFTTSFLANNPYSQYVEDNWVLFRDTLLTIDEKCVPHKLLNPHKHLPCMVEQKDQASDEEKKEIL